MESGSRSLAALVQLILGNRGGRIIDRIQGKLTLRIQMCRRLTRTAYRDASASVNKQAPFPVRRIWRIAFPYVYDVLRSFTRRVADFAGGAMLPACDAEGPAEVATVDAVSSSTWTEFCPLRFCFPWPLHIVPTILRTMRPPKDCTCFLIVSRFLGFFSAVFDILSFSFVF